MTEPKKADYRDTVFLPKTEFPMRGSLPQKEPELLARWRGMDLYGRLRTQSKGREKFILHDGPAYSNGNIHIGTALNRILKDVVIRSYQMLGFDAPYIPGWDCHGLPIEWKIEEQYRAGGKDKDNVPALQLIAECRDFAAKWVEVQSAEFQRLGVFGDWDRRYTTMTKKAEAQILREIYKFLDNGLLYKGVKPVMWSVVEKTALAEAEIEYQDHKSTTLWVKFPIKIPPKIYDNRSGSVSPEAHFEKASIVIWTTTPWTIPGNRAIAYGDEITYTLVNTKNFGNLLVASDRLADFITETKTPPEDYREITWVKGNMLAEVVCSHPFKGRPGSEGYFDYDVPLYQGDFVTTEAGTGFVHIAPGHGEDDFNLGQKHHIKFDETVGADGRYLPNVKGFAGLYVYKPDGSVGEANGAVIKALIEANALLAKKNITHSYPHSWRSKAPLIFRTTPQWFIALDRVFAPAKAGATPGKPSTLRELAMKAIGETEWIPSIGENRIRGMIENRPDWCVSRQRAWGVPIALFVNKKTGEVLRDNAVQDRVAKSFEEQGIEAWHKTPAQQYLGDAHKAEDFEQVFDIVDVWFDSASTHAFVLDPACNGGAWPELQWPATLYLEGSDQHRGWFHSSLLEACGTRGRAPYEKVLTHGFVLDEQGRKMSKSLGNVVAPQEVIDKMGADILRLWAISTDYTQDMRAGPEILKQTGDLYRRLRNTLRYLLGALDGMSVSEHVPTAEMPELERWVLHRLFELDGIIRADIKKFDFNHMLTELHNFCSVDLSAFYFDIRKDSLYCDRPDSKKRRAARTVMEHLFNHLAVWLAPILCFTAEEAWLARSGSAEDSVHLQAFPKVPGEWKNEALAQKWEQVRAVRREVTGIMEFERQNNKIGSSLQAHPHVYPLKPDQQSILKGLNAEICITSDLTIHSLEETRVLKDKFLATSEHIGVVIELASGKKCERCWQVLPEVGTHPDHPDLCNRCHDAVLHLRKEAA